MKPAHPNCQYPNRQIPMHKHKKLNSNNTKRKLLNKHVQMIMVMMMMLMMLMVTSWTWTTKNDIVDDFHICQTFLITLIKCLSPGNDNKLCNALANPTENKKKKKTHAQP